MARKGTGRQQRSRLADMSLPAGERGRRKSTRTSRRPVPAQLQPVRAEETARRPAEA